MSRKLKFFQHILQIECSQCYLKPAIVDPAFESAVYLRPLYECVFDSRVPRLIIIEIYVRGACPPSSFRTGAKPENMVGTD